MHPEALTKESNEIWPFLKKVPPGFYLAGGTALALQIGHRISVDFDFFISDYISKSLLTAVKKVFLDQSLNVSVNNPDELTVFVNNVKATFLRYPFPLVKPLKDFEGLKLLDAVEIAATKAYTIGRRGSFKDYIDVYFVLSNKLTTLDEIINLAEQKYGADFNARLFLEQLVYLEDISDENINFLHKPVSKTEIAEFFKEEIKKIKL